jgi:hypothetical protein
MHPAITYLRGPVEIGKRTCSSLHTQLERIQPVPDEGAEAGTAFSQAYSSQQEGHKGHKGRMKGTFRYLVILLPFVPFVFFVASLPS